MYSLVKTPLAENDLINIWQYSFEEWGEHKANTYLNGIDLALKRLCQNPTLYRERSEFTPSVRFMPFEQHICIYQLQEQGILLIRVLHQSMDIGAQLK